MQPWYLAIDLGATRLAAGVVGDDGTVVIRDRVATPARHVWPTLTRLVRRVLAAAPVDERPIACGVTCPGPLDHRSDTLAPVHLPTWAGFPLRRELEHITEMPVAIDTPGRAFALAETWCGSAIEVRELMTVLVGDVVDAGIITRGRLAEGQTGNVGQLGHLVVAPEGDRCVCGGAGCLDVYAGALAIEATINRPLARTPVALVERAGTMCGRAIASLSALLDPAEVFVAGRVPATFGDAFFHALAQELDQRTGLSHLSGLAVRDLTESWKGPLVGAAAVARAAPSGNDPLG